MFCFHNRASPIWQHIALYVIKQLCPAFNLTQKPGGDIFSKHDRICLNIRRILNNFIISFPFLRLGIKIERKGYLIVGMWQFLQQIYNSIYQKHVIKTISVKIGNIEKLFAIWPIFLWFKTIFYSIVFFFLLSTERNPFINLTILCQLYLNLFDLKCLISQIFFE